MYKILIYGRVHGVGFRAFVSKVAIAHKLVGTVRNIPDGVEIIVNDKNFMNKLSDIPMFARVDSYTIEESNIVGVKYKDFRIIGSEY